MSQEGAANPPQWAIDIAVDMVDDECAGQDATSINARRIAERAAAAVRDGLIEPADYAEPKTDAERVRLFIHLHLAKERLERQLETISSIATPLGEQLLQYFIENNVQNINADGCTVYLRSQLWASLAGETPEDRAAAVEALRASEAGALIKETVNSNSLSAWVREGAADGRFPEDPETMLPVLPVELRKHVKLRDETKVQVRKGR